MKKQQHDDRGVNSASDTAASDERLAWIAPLQSIELFSVSEFTQTFSNPGDDSSGIFTQS